MRVYLRLIAALAASAAAGLVATSVSVASHPQTTAGVPGNGGNADSWVTDISRNGRYVLFASSATNLVRGDTNGFNDVYVRDTVARTTRWVSAPVSGGQANDYSYYSAISDDGRFVAFVSAASNLVPRDNNGVEDLFLKDLQTGSLKRIAAAPFSRWTTVALSADGRRIVFVSSADDLVPDDDRAGLDAFMYDASTGKIRRLSAVAPRRDVVGPSVDVAPNGKFASFVSSSTSDTGYTCDTQWVWRANTGKVTRADRQPYCHDENDGGGLYQVFARNAGTAYATNSGYDTSVNFLTVRAQGSTPAYERGCDNGDDPNYSTCSFDLAAWAAVGVSDHGRSERLTRFDVTGAVRLGPVGEDPAISSDGFVVAYSTPGRVRQVRTWDYRTGVITLISTP